MAVANADDARAITEATLADRATEEADKLDDLVDHTLDLIERAAEDGKSSFVQTYGTSTMAVAIADELLLRGFAVSPNNQTLTISW